MLRAPYFVVLLLCAWSAVLNKPGSWFVRFAEANFILPQNISCGDGLLCTGAALSDTHGNIWITSAADISSQADLNLGMALYVQPIRMVQDGMPTSFKSSFTFEIFPKLLDIRNGTQVVAGGDGMAFVMLGDRWWVGASGRSLGVYNSAAEAGPKTVAVEFDTFQNGELIDIDQNHIGIDFNNAISKAYRSADDLKIRLFYGETLYSWVDYDGIAQNMEVRLSTLSSRPIEHFLQYSVNLSDWVDEFMWVGFTAANGGGQGFGRYHIYDWKFETSGLPNVTGSEDSSTVAISPSRAVTDSIPRPRTSWILVVAIGLASLVTLVIAILLFGMLFFMKRNQRFRQLDREMSAGSYSQGLDLKLLGSIDRCFNYKQLSEATGGFCEKAKLGQGGFGSVYRGVLRGVGNGMLIAVKRIHNQSKQGEREFISEVSIISQLRHRNVVQLLGWSNDNGRFLLVYEFMPNGSLDKALFGTRPRADEKIPNSGPELVLSWNQRMHIISGVAKALHYLHDEWRQQVIHRDVKSSNIMLDNQFNAMLGDFGLARAVNREQNPATTMVAGTCGYLAPEIVVTRRYTEKSDTFAFGVVALEIACGRIAYEETSDVDPFILVDWVWDYLSQDKLMTVVDPRLEGNFDDHEMETVLLTGLLCTHPDPAQRPSMQVVIQVLAGHVPVPNVPASKPAPMYLSNLPNARRSHDRQRTYPTKWVN